MVDSMAASSAVLRAGLMAECSAVWWDWTMAAVKVEYSVDWLGFQLVDSTVDERADQSADSTVDERAEQSADLMAVGKAVDLAGEMVERSVERLGQLLAPVASASK